MKKLLLFFFILLVFYSCKLPSADKRYSDAEDVIFQLKFNPEPGSDYHYDIKNSTETEVELEEEEVKTVILPQREFPT